MNDPHVESLLYTIEHGALVDYSDAEPFVHEASAFWIRVENGRVRFEMLEHCATPEEARALVEPFIDRWEFATTLDHGPRTFSLRFLDSHIVDRDPSPEPPGSISVHADVRLGAAVVRAELRVVSPYPRPPSGGLALTPDVRTMWRRYLGYRRGEEPLPSMAYFCHTLLMSPTGEPSLVDRDAARRYRVARNVLSKIRSLSSRKGGSVARKADAAGHGSSVPRSGCQDPDKQGGRGGSRSGR